MESRARLPGHRPAPTITTGLPAAGLRPRKHTDTTRVCACCRAQCPNPAQESERCRRIPEEAPTRPTQKNPSTDFASAAEVNAGSKLRVLRQQLFDPVLSLPRSDLTYHSFGSRGASKDLCNITVYIFWLLAFWLRRFRRKRFSVVQIKALTREEFGPCFTKFLIPPGRWGVGGGMRFPRPPIPSLTTASGISKLNSFAEQAQSIIKDCQATPLDRKSVCGTIFHST